MMTPEQIIQDDPNAEGWVLPNSVSDDRLLSEDQIYMVKHRQYTQPIIGFWGSISCKLRFQTEGADYAWHEIEVMKPCDPPSPETIIAMRRLS